MKRVRLLAIERDPAEAPGGGPGGDYIVGVVLDVDGQPERHVITVRPRTIAGFDASLLVASEALQALFQDQQTTLYQLCKLVGDALRGAPVRVPQAIAA